MTRLEQDILATLAQMDDMVKSMATAERKPDLKPVFQKLDSLTSELPQDTDPNLLHYLRKKSYAKARLFLEGREAENQIGSCRHV